MQLTPVEVGYSVFINESVSCDYNRFYGHVPKRGRVLGIFNVSALT